MYIVPQKYVCKKCGYECSWTPDSGHAAPLVYEDSGEISPVCPMCWKEWVEKNIGIMERKRE